MPDPAPSPPPAIQAQAYSPDGQPLDAAGSDLTDLVAQGKATFQKGATVHVVQQNGKVGTIAADQAQKAAQQGMRLATDDEIHAAKVQAKYGGASGQAMTALLGAASGATLGLSDIAANALGGEQYVAEHEQANPLTFGISQAAGAVAPMLVPGAEGAAAAEAAEGIEAASGASKALEAAKAATKVVSAPTRAVSRVGEGVEKVVQGVLGGPGEGSAITAMAKKAIAKGAGSAAEMALIGGAQEVEEQKLQGNPEVNGEKVLVAMGHWALLGLAGGAGLSASGDIGSRVLGKASPMLRSMAEHEAFRTLGSRSAFTKAANKLPGGVEGVGSELLNRAAADGRPLLRFGDRVEDAAPRISEARQQAGEEVDAIRRRADEASFEGPRVNDVRARIQKDVLPELQKLEGTNADAIGKVQTLMDDLDRFAGVPRVEDVHSIADANQYAEKLQNARLTFQQAADFRGKLDDAIKWATNPLAPVNEAAEAMKRVRGILEDELEEAGERAANKLGGTFKAEYKDAKLAYRRLTVADQAAQDAVSRGEANRRISLTDYLGGDIASHAARALGGGVVGGAAGGSEGGGEGMLEGAAAGAFGALAHHAIRTRGNAAAAVLLDKLAAMRGIERAVQHVDTQIERGVGGFFREDGRVPVKLKEPIAGEAGEHPSDTAAKKVLHAAANDSAHAASIEKAASPISDHAPMTANSFQRAALRGTMYLAGQVPKPHLRPSITPQFDKPFVSDAQRQDYLRKVQTVHDPLQILADMRDGRVTRAQVDAIKMVYPSLYQDIVQKVHDRLASLKSPLDYGQKLQLSLLGIGTDPTLQPEFQQAMAAGYSAGQSQQPAQTGGKHPRGGGAKRPVDDQMAKDVELALGPRSK